MRKGKQVWASASVLLLVLSLVASAMAGETELTEKQLFRKGAHLWPYYCGHCHNARPGGEFNRLEWDTLMLHMRVRANVPAEDAKALRAYLRAH